MANFSKEELQYIASQVQPYLLELVKSNGLDVDSIEVVEDTEGITSLPAYDNRGGTKKVVRVPLSTFAKPAEDAAANLEGSITKANTAAETANTAADKANVAVEEINSIKNDIEQAVSDAQQAAEEATNTVASVNEKMDEFAVSEQEREEAEQARVDAETARATEFETLKSESQAATESANDTADHPTYIGEDNYVYKWNKDTQTYDKTDIYVKGDKGDQGEKGDKGDQGVKGDKGDQGEKGDSLTWDSITDDDKAEICESVGDSIGADIQGAISSANEAATAASNAATEANEKIDEIEQLQTVIVTAEDEGEVIDAMETLTTDAIRKTAQTLTEDEKKQARTNIGALGSSELDSKQDVITDLESIRSGAAKGATAIQEHQDISHLATNESVDEKIANIEVPEVDLSGYATKDDVSLLQESINDAGTVKSIVAGEGLEGGTITEDGTISLPTFVEEGTVGLPSTIVNNFMYLRNLSQISCSALAVTEYPVTFTYDKHGRITGATKSAMNCYELSLLAATNSLMGFMSAEDKVKLDGIDMSTKQDKVMIVDHGTDDTTYEISPNVLHKWGEVATLTLTLGAVEDETVANYYMVEFVSGATATTLSLPDSVTWASDVSIDANKTYQISILNGCGVIGGF